MKIQIFFLLFLFNLNSFAQEAPEIIPQNFISLSAGLQTADFQKPVFGISYRFTFKENWWFKTGLSYNSFSGENLMTDSLLYASNSIQIIRNQEQYNRSYLVSAGIQYNLARYVNFSMDLILGYNQNHQSFNDRAKAYDSLEGAWIWNTDALSKEYPDLFTNNGDQTSVSFNNAYNAYLGHATYLVTGGAVSIGGCLPVGKRWEFGLTYSSSFLRYAYLNNRSLATELNYEGMTVYPNIENIITEPSSFNLWNHSLSLSLAFGF
ncbi:MAG: hypothetical protein WDZ35_00155 [Crocinitomicaceae bacterium]